MGGWASLKNKAIRYDGSETTVDASGYSPFTYVVSCIFIFIARQFTGNILILAYCARLGQFFSCAFLLYLAVKHIPTAKNLLMLIALLPMTIQEMATLSGDAMAITLTLDVVAFVMYQRDRSEGVMTPLEIASLFFMSFFLGQCKYIYVFVCFLFIFIPRERFGSLKKKIICAVCVVTVTGVTMLWMLSQINAVDLSQIFYVVGAKSGGSEAAGSFNGYSIWQAMLRTFQFRHRLYIATSIAFGFGDLDIYPHIGFTYILILLLLYVGILEEKREQKLTALFRISAIGVSMMSVIALFYTFRGWTSAETGITNGLMGRYFIPMFLPVMLGISFDFKQVRFPVIKREIFLPFVAVVDLCVLISVFRGC